MAPVNPGSYRFRKESIAELRQRLGLSQAEMAQRIGVPKNTVSRWETGATTPDADSLAAIYSLGQEKGIVASFFAPSKEQTKVRDAALVYWDLSLIPTWDIRTLEQLDPLITEEVRKRVPHVDREIFKAFMGSTAPTVSDALGKLGWRVREQEGWVYPPSSTDDIYSQALSDAGQDPDRSVVFLVTADKAHVDLIEELRDRNVLTYVMAPPSMGIWWPSVSPELIAAVGKRRFIDLR